MAKSIPLTRGFVAVVDDEDYQRLSVHPWHANVKNHGRVYAERFSRHPDGRKTSIRMHREILGAPPGVDVDHRDRDGLNNRRANLRLATNSQNRANSKKRADGVTSPYRGVHLHKRLGKWAAQIRVDGDHRHLGVFAAAEDAARVYDAAAFAAWGDFARLNFPVAEGAP